MLEMLKIKRTPIEMESKREKVIEQLFQKSAVIKSLQMTSISTEDLRLLFELYDLYFFENWFRNHYAGKIKFSLSRKMTKSAGKTLCPGNISKIKPENLVLEIRIGVDFFLYYGQLGKSNTVCGVRTTSSLEALLLVFEHELCHVIEFLLFGKSSCKGTRFKTIAANMFGHSESYHRLPTNRQIASKVFGLRIGDSVSFKHNERQLTGLLYNVNKRAVVLVPDRSGILTDRQGKRYSKYYVPLKLLKSIE